MFCPKCGNEVKDTMKFCGKCGSTLVSAEKVKAYMEAMAAEPEPEVPIAPVPPAVPIEQATQPTQITPSVQQTVYEMPYSEEEPKPKEKKSKKKLWAILIPVIALIVAIAILVPTVIIPWWQGRNAEPVKRRTSSLAAGYNSSVALKADGMVYTAGLDDESTKEVQTWTEIVALDSSGYITAGIRKDGTVVFADKDKTEWNADTWTNIDKVSVGKYSVVGVKKDGTAVTESKNDAKIDVSTWKDIAYAAVSDNYAVGVKNDGGAVVAGDNGGMKAEIEKWTDIVSVSVSENVAVGLKSDGTVVVSVKDGTNYDFNVDDWKDIIAVSAGTSHVVGLKSDGTVVSTGDTSNGKLDVSAWEKIVDISAGNEHTLGLREDGTVTAVGKNDNGQCNVSEWRDILIPILEEIKQAEDSSESSSLEAEKASSADTTSTTQAPKPVYKPDIAKIYTDAYNHYYEWYHECQHLGEEEIDSYIVIAEDGINSKDDLINLSKAYFTEELAIKTINQNGWYREQNGKLYTFAYAKRFITPQDYVLYATKISDTEYEIEVEGYEGEEYKIFYVDDHWVVDKIIFAPSNITVIDGKAPDKPDYSDIVKKYKGTYQSTWGNTNLEFTITYVDNATGAVEATFNFIQPYDNPNAKTGSYKMHADKVTQNSDGTLSIPFTGYEWISQPSGTVMITFTLIISADRTKATSSDKWKIDLSA